MALALCLSAFLPRTAYGDQVVAGGANYPGAIVVALKEGRLEFRTAAGKLEAVWLSDVDRVIVDRGGMFADLNQAERYLAGGEPDRAIERYRRALKLSEGFWSDLIVARMLAACNRAGRLDQVVRNFIRVVNGEASGPALAARLLPDAFPVTRTKATSRAVEELDTAIARAADEEKRALFHLLRYEILRRTGDQRSANAVPTVAALAVPASARIERVFAIQLAALNEALKEHVEPAVWDSLDRAIRWSPQEILPSFLLLKGKTLLRMASTQEDIIRAGWSFMRVAIHMPDDPRAAEGLYAAALALERIGRPDKAVSLLEECLAHKRLGDDTRKLAQAALGRLQSAVHSPE